MITCASVAAYGCSLGDYHCLSWGSIPNFIPSHPCISSSCVFSLFFAWHISFLPLFFPDMFSSPMWTDLTHVRDPYLRSLADKFPDVVPGATADNTTLTYLNGLRDGALGPPSFPRLLCCRRQPPMLPCICLVSFKRPLLHPWFSQPFTASVWRTMVLVYSLPLVIHSHRRS